jgi:hypothetical protein
MSEQRNTVPLRKPGIVSSVVVAVDALLDSALHVLPEGARTGNANTGRNFLDEFAHVDPGKVQALELGRGEA